MPTWPHVIESAVLDCPTCADLRTFEALSCPDGHGDECPERACTECGTAVFFDPILPRRHVEFARHAA